VPTQPTGTVSLLFTDIEGSTRLLEQLGPEAYREALAEHRRRLRAVFEQHHGYEVDYEGDAFFVAFQEASAAVAAAGDGQSALAGGPIRVRMGIHTGTPLADPPKYVGRDVHLAARIMAAGHGGQVLLSQTTRALVSEDVSDLGEHRLKDFDRPVSLYQLGEHAFPPLKTISNSNLPRPASSFVGRSREVREVTALLRGPDRLVTLTGPGGSGKTRLALEVAAEALGQFRAGVFWVGLATVFDPRLVLPTIGEVLGAVDEPAAHIGERELLLLLDNLEQAIEAAPELAELLERCPHLRLLVTSRELLQVRGEVEYEVLPLDDPDAVALFTARSGLSEAPVISNLCRRLDNIPLAVELAAARARSLSLEQILERLGDRLDLFRGGRDADPRQRTLRATIEWSHDLLDDDEQHLLARLGVFAGGCSLAGAEAVCDGDLDTLHSLVTKSLLRHSEGRYWMLETIRAFADERLAEDAETHAEAIRSFSRYTASLVEQDAPADDDDEPPAQWLHAVDVEEANVRAVLEHAAESDHDLLVRLVAVLRFHWYRRSRFTEGMRWVEAALARPIRSETLERAVRWAESNFAYRLGDAERAFTAAQAELAAAKRAGDDHACMLALRDLGNGLVKLRRYDEAEAAYRASAAAAERLGDIAARHHAELNIAPILITRGDYPSAREVALRALAGARDQQNNESTVISSHNVGMAYLLETRPTEAIPFFADAVGAARLLDWPEGIVFPLEGLAAAAAGCGQPLRAAAMLGAARRLREPLALHDEDLEQEVRERTLDALRAELGEARFAEAWAGGAEGELEELLDETLAWAQGAAPPTV
jgi:predicted ATPase